ncbi:MAG: relaxase/mobilization nuclease domain-containing protein [Spirosomataceae bacterium]
MIGKVASIGTSFLGTLEYCYYATRPNRSLDRSQVRGELVYFQHLPVSTTNDSKQIKGANEALLNLEKMAERMRRTANLNHRIEKPVWHQAFSFPVGERVNTETMAEICQLFAQRFGMENNQLVAFRHADKDHDHFHIIANRISLDGENTAKTRFNFLEMGRFCRDVEQLYGLTPTTQMKRVIWKEQQSSDTKGVTETIDSKRLKVRFG